MSRFKNAARSLTSGYAAIATNAVYSLASVPLALHYLTKEQFGLWALVTQISGYLLLLDLGMSGSISRFLIDHKDERAAARYGSVIKTGSIVLLVQGVCIALGGILISRVMPQILDVPQQFA